MTDTGTTGIQVAPAVPTEDEMSKATALLQRGLDSILQLSRMSDDVAALRTDLDKMRREVDGYRQTIDWQSETISKLRQERDAAAHDLSVTKNDLHQVISERDKTASDNLSLRDTIATLQGNLLKAHAERDDHGFRVMELEEEVRSLSAKLDAIREGYRSIFGEEPKAAMQATPEPPKPVPELVHASAEVVPEPPHIDAKDGFTPVHEPTRRYLSEWAPGASWDEAKNQYYVDA